MKGGIETDHDVNSCLGKTHNGLVCVCVCVCVCACVCVHACACVCVCVHLLLQVAGYSIKQETVASEYGGNDRETVRDRGRERMRE